MTPEQEKALDEFVEKGRKAWADVPDASAWVREIRGNGINNDRIQRITDEIYGTGKPNEELTDLQLYIRAGLPTKTHTTENGKFVVESAKRFRVDRATMQIFVLDANGH